MGKGKSKSNGRKRGARRKNLSTFDISRLLGVDPGSVANWIDAGMLKAHRTPGGHRRVTIEDLIRFLRHHKIPTPPGLEQSWACLVVIDHAPDYFEELLKIAQERHPECEVFKPSDAFQAGVIVVRYKPDIILLDLQMPGMDAFEACRTIKSYEQISDAVVLAVADGCSQEDKRKILQCGAEACLSKPINPSQLVELMESALIRRGS